jgi:hypothetical protein
VTVRRAGMSALALVAVFFGINLYSATSGFVTAYDTYDRLELRLTRFAYSSADQPVDIGFEIVNPTAQTVQVATIEVFIDAGVHRVGGGTANPRERFEPGQAETFAIEGDINDSDYVARLNGQQITWGVSGRVLVELHPGLDSVWIPFSGSYDTEPVT